MTNIQSNILIMTDSVVIKVPENTEVTLNQEADLNHKSTKLDQLTWNRGRTIILSEILITLQLIILRSHSVHYE